MSDPLGRPCVCGTMRIPTDQLSVTDTDTVHRHGGPCYVDESRSITDVVQRARQALDGITPGKWESYSGTSDGGAWIEGANGEFVAAELTHEDARFVAAAPDLVRELADEVETLRATIERVTDEVQFLNTYDAIIRAALDQGKP